MGMQNTQASYPRVCTHESQSFSPELLESKGTDSEHLTRAPTILPANDFAQMGLRFRCNAFLFIYQKLKNTNEHLTHLLWLKFGVDTSETTLLLDSCLKSCIFTSLSNFIRENCTPNATLCINFLLFGCFRLNFLKIYATILGIYEG